MYVQVGPYGFGVGITDQVGVQGIAFANASVGVSGGYYVTGEITLRGGFSGSGQGYAGLSTIPGSTVVASGQIGLDNGSFFATLGVGRENRLEVGFYFERVIVYTYDGVVGSGIRAQAPVIRVAGYSGRDGDFPRAGDELSALDILAEQVHLASISRWPHPLERLAQSIGLPAGELELGSSEGAHVLGSTDLATHAASLALPNSRDRIGSDGWIDWSRNATEHETLHSSPSTETRGSDRDHRASANEFVRNVGNNFPSPNNPQDADPQASGGVSSPSPSTHASTSHLGSNQGSSVNASTNTPLPTPSVDQEVRTPIKVKTPDEPKKKNPIILDLDGTGSTSPNSRNPRYSSTQTTTA